MQIELLPYELRALDALALKFSLERGLTIGLAQDLKLFARLTNRLCRIPNLSLGWKQAKRIRRLNRERDRR